MGRDPLGVDTDLFVRGNADAETLWQGLVHGANNQHPKQGATGRWGVADYNSLGYVAHDHGRHGTVARTLEYAYDDWCIWRFGKAIGGRLVFRMSSKPVKTRGTTLAAAPYSMSKEEKK